MTQQHVHQQIPDYVLGLLPQNEQQQVDRHTLACPDCRVALRQERELTQLVRTTLTAAQPPTNLRQFMPPVPPKSRRIGLFYFSLNWPQQLAPLTLVLFLLLGSAGIYLSEQRGLWQNPTPTAITATLTDSPTATINETRSEQALNLRTTAVPTTANQPNITATPAPNPTPIAALNVKRET